MNKREMIRSIANRVGCTEKNVNDVLREYQFLILQQIQKEKSVVLLGLGQLKVLKRSERKGVNPVTKVPITIPAKEVPKLAPSKKLKDLVAGVSSDIFAFEY